MISIVLASLLSVIPPVRPGATPASSAPEAAPSQLTDAELQQRIETLMGNIDSRIPEDQWRTLGPRGTALLERMAQDPTVLSSKRAQAIAGLSVIAAASSAPVLLRLATSEEAPLTVRLAAVHGTASVVPAARLGSALKPVLERARNGHVRSAAAEVLSRHGGCSLVRAQAQREDDRVRMQRAHERCNDQ